MDLITSFQDINSDDRLLENVRDIVVNNSITQSADSIFSIVPGIKGGQQVVAAKDQEYITKQQEGCNPTFTGWDFNGLAQKWNPKEQYVGIKLCYTDFKGAFTQWALANGLDRKKLDEADFFTFITELISGAIQRDLVRIAIWGNKDIAADGWLAGSAKGTAADYTTIDAGLVKTLQTFKANSELAGQFVDIAKNNEASSAAQLALDSDAAYLIYDQMVENMNYEFGDQFLTSNTLYKNYRDLFKGKLLESGVSAIQNEFMPQFDGRALTHLKHTYDKYVKQDFNTAAQLQPHFALLADRNNLQIGIDDNSALTDLRFEYVGGADESFYIKASYLADFKIPNPYAISAAF